MIYTKKKVPINNSELEALTIMAPSEEILLFDIETTGFSRTNDSIVSITAAEILNSNVIIHQWFAESQKDEKEILDHFNALQDSKPYHITYNGHSFDIPFLYCKYQYYNTFTTLNKCKSCDLYRVSKKALSLESYKLKAIEKVLGIHREDGISGKECVELYKRFLATNDPNLANLILQHNFEDVLNLIYVSKVLTHLIEPERISLIPLKWSIGSHNWYLDSISLKSQLLTLEVKGFKSNTSTLSLDDKQLYFTNGDLLTLKSIEGITTVKIAVQIVSHELGGLQYDFLNSDSLGLASTLKFDSSPEEMLCRYGNYFNIDVIPKLIASCIQFLLA